MKNKFAVSGYTGFFVWCMIVAVFCILMGLVVSFRSAGGAFADAVGTVRRISFDGTRFSESIQNALTADLVYCITVIVFTSGFPAAVFPALGIVLRCFALGATVGLAAKCRVMKDAISIFLAAFVSNVLILPLYILLFVMSINFSVKNCSGEFGIKDSIIRYFVFGAKVSVIFAVMCAAECIQMGVGVLALKLF